MSDAAIPNPIPPWLPGMNAAEPCLAPGKLWDKRAVLQNTQKEGERKSLLGAEQNYYKQLFLESSGNPGDLRISEVIIQDQKRVHQPV